MVMSLTKVIDVLHKTTPHWLYLFAEQAPIPGKITELALPINTSFSIMECCLLDQKQVLSKNRNVGLLIIRPTDSRRRQAYRVG
jgi:hypothetical protein